MACMDTDTVHTDSAYTVDYAWHGILSPKTGLGPPLMRGGTPVANAAPLRWAILVDIHQVSDSSRPSGAQAAFRKSPECQTSGALD